MKNTSMGLRIIGGSLRGKKLPSVRGMATRPTSSRVRESIFNIIASRVPDAVVLDLFSGTGILGIEALSRGARFSLFVDNAKAPVSVIRKNLQACRLAKRATVVLHDIRKGLPWLASQPWPFDIVFMDPPYNRGFIADVFPHLHHSGALAKDALVVVEHSPREPIPGDHPEFIPADQRKYGKTLVSFVNYII